MTGVSDIIEGRDQRIIGNFILSIITQVKLEVDSTSSTISAENVKNIILEAIKGQSQDLLQDYTYMGGSLESISYKKLTDKMYDIVKQAMTHYGTPSCNRRLSSSIHSILRYRNSEALYNTTDDCGLNRWESLGIEYKLKIYLDEAIDKAVEVCNSTDTSNKMPTAASLIAFDNNTTTTTNWWMKNITYIVLALVFVVAATGAITLGYQCYRNKKHDGNTSETLLSNS